MRVLLVAILLTGAAGTNCVEFPCKCECGNLAEGNRDDGVCIRLDRPVPKGVRPNIDKEECEGFYEEGQNDPFYFCCVDSQDRPVSPPPEFVPDKMRPIMRAWHAMTDKFGCDPCESPDRPVGKSCLYYKDRSGEDPPEEPKVAFNNRDEDACLKWAGNKENVEVFWCGEPPKGEACTPTPAPAKTYSYNFETMQPTASPTPQS